MLEEINSSQESEGKQIELLIHNANENKGEIEFKNN